MMSDGGDVCTDVQILKFVQNSREPVVVETKTTTTTTTVTKRICIANDANIDITDIQSLLNTNNDTKTNAIPNTAQSNAKHTVTNKTTTANVKGTSNFELSNQNQNQSLLSSTKIDGLIEPDEKENICAKKKAKSQHETFLSPNLSKIPTENHFKIKEKNTECKKKEKKTKPPKMNTYSTRSKKASINDETGAVDKEKYISGLINEYMSLEKKPQRNRTKKSTPKGKENKKEQEKKPISPVSPKDLSAIFENSVEGNFSPPQSTKLQTIASSDVDFDNNEYDISLADYQSENTHEDGAIHEGAVHDELKKNKSKRLAANASKSNQSTRQTGATKKAEPKQKTAPQNARTSKIKSNMESNDKQAPIMIYSPSARYKLKSSADNKFILTKKMIEKKLKMHPNSAKSMLDRFDEHNEMTVDAESRLIYYPQSNDEESDEESTDDLLNVLRNQTQPLLVKEYIA